MTAWALITVAAVIAAYLLGVATAHCKGELESELLHECVRRERAERERQKNP